MTSDEGDELLARLQTLGDQDVVLVGELAEAIVRAWTTATRGNLAIIVTGERRGHYLARHPDIAPHERRLLEVLLRPDEVHRNRTDRDVAVFYLRLTADRYLRAAVLMQSSPTGKQHSLLTFRLARAKEFQKSARNRA